MKFVERIREFLGAGEQINTLKMLMRKSADAWSDYSNHHKKYRRTDYLDAMHSIEQLQFFPQSTDTVIHLLTGDDREIAAIAAEVLVLKGILDERVIEPLISILGNPVTRYAAKTALEKIGDPAIPYLVKTLEAEINEARKDAALTLEGIGWEPDTARTRAAYLIALGRFSDCPGVGAPAVEPLIRELSNSDWGIRKEACDALYFIGERAVEYIGTKAAVGALIGALADPEKRVRQAACRALGLTGNAAATQGLIDALRDSSSGVRDRAADALGEIGMEEAVDPLRQMLISEMDDSVLHRVASALGKIGGKKGLDSLIEALGGRAAGAAAMALSTIDLPEIRDALFNSLQGFSYSNLDDYRLYKTKVFALYEMGDPRSMDPLIDMLTARHDLEKGKLWGAPKWDWETRRKAATALIDLYQKAVLSPDQKMRILQQESKITEEHIDQGFCGGDHADNGVGIPQGYWKYVTNL